MLTRLPIRTVLALALLAAHPLRAAPVSMCTQAELDALNAYYMRAFQLGLNAQRLDVDTVMAFAAEGDEVMRRLSPGCRSALERVGDALQEHAQAARRPVQLPGMLYDAGSDTYTVPGAVSCGPSACVAVQ